MSIPQQFPVEDIPVILESFYKCGKQLTKASDTELENNLTRKLVRRLRRESVFRDGHLFVDSNLEIFKDDNIVENTSIDGILDFRIMSPRISHPEVYFVVEAKRLNVIYNGKKSSLASKYVKEGMMRFISKKYAPEMKKHSMLGYVYDCNIPEAINSVVNAIYKFPKELAMDKIEFASADITPETDVYSTRHRKAEDSCEIYHLFLPIETR